MRITKKDEFLNIIGIYLMSYERRISILTNNIEPQSRTFDSPIVCEHKKSKKRQEKNEFDMQPLH